MITDGLVRSLRRKLIGLSGWRRYKQLGRTAQDGGQWLEAARYYRHHLQRFPREGAIWVQLGHCLKEGGDLTGALAAYERAASLIAAKADPHLQLGHLLRRMGRDEEAAKAFRRAEQLDPTWTVASDLRELGYRSTRHFSQDTLSAASGLVLVEVNDLLGYLEAHPTLSGIQRVQAEFIRNIVGRLVTHADDYVFVVNGEDGNCWRLRHDDIMAVVAYAQLRVVDHADLRALIDTCRRQSTSIPLVPSQTFLVLGAFWGYGGVGSRYSAISQAGLTIGVLIYDLIPITHPEYCAADLAHDFTLSFADGMWVFDFALTISEFTAAEVRRFVRHYELSEMPVVPVPLAVERKAPQTPSLPDTKVRQLGKVIEQTFDFDKPYILVVSTIEARKNHSYLVSIWLELRRRGVAVPRLVFVGRIGWRVETLLGTLKDMHYLDGDVIILSDVSEVTLGQLYERCMFTAFPSFVEGWGLPVGESLTHGKLCVASQTSSIPEVAGDLAVYVDPYNASQGMEVITSLLADAQRVADYERRIAEQFRERTWTEVSSDICAAVERLRGERRRATPAMAHLNPAQLFQPRSLHRSAKLPTDYPRNPLRLMFGADWFNIEDFGAWLRGAEGRLRFATPLPAGTSVTVYLRVHTAPFCTGPVELNVGTDRPDGGRNITSFAIEASSEGVLHRAEVNALGAIEVTFSIVSEVTAEHSGSGARYFSIGLSEIFYLIDGDAASPLTQ